MQDGELTCWANTTHHKAAGHRQIGTGFGQQQGAAALHSGCARISVSIGAFKSVSTAASHGEAAGAADRAEEPERAGGDINPAVGSEHDWPSPNVSAAGSAGSGGEERAANGADAVEREGLVGDAQDAGAAGQHQGGAVAHHRADTGIAEAVRVEYLHRADANVSWSSIGVRTQQGKFARAGFEYSAGADDTRRATQGRIRDAKRARRAVEVNDAANKGNRIGGDAVNCRQVTGHEQSPGFSGDFAAIERKRADSFIDTIEVERTAGVYRDGDVIRDLFRSHQPDERRARTVANDQRPRKSGVALRNIQGQRAANNAGGAGVTVCLR